METLEKSPITRVGALLPPVHTRELSMKRCPAILVAGFALLLVDAAPVRAESVESKARDASSTFIETQHFIVGRIGRDCLTDVGRKETPAEFQMKWQRDNARYFDAARKYLAARLREIENSEARDAVERAYYASAQKTGEAATTQLFSKGPKDEVCKYAMTLVDSGSMNVGEFGKATKLPIMQDVEDLAKWGGTAH